jgi:hypothetical protein
MAHSISAKVYGGPWAMWWEAKNDQANTGWHHEVITVLRPYSTGYYVGESNTVERPANAVEAFSPEKWQRLADLRATYDPEGVFFGFYDGNVANGVQTGMTGPQFNGYSFHIWEGDVDWILADRYPGTFGAGLWYQTGLLHATNGVSQNGTGG